ncbi:g8268 [Coccomyxa elongata]
MMEAQVRTRRNTQEARDYLADLLKWQEEQKQKDENLRREATVSQKEPDTGSNASKDQCIRPEAFRHSNDSSTASPTPPPQITKQLRQNAAQALDARTTAADHTHDHATKKWESFDADSVLADLSEDDRGRADKSQHKPASQLSGADKIEAAGMNGITDAKERSSADSHIEAVQSRRLQRKEQESGTKAAPIRQMPAEPSTPEGWKERGNAFFRKGDWAAAKKAYTKGIEAGESSTGYANRAMASLKLGEVADAEQDCTRALALDPNYLKAWQRRAAARAASGRLLDAIDDLESALRLEPTSKALAAERRDLVKQYEAAEAVQVPTVDMKIKARLSPDLPAARVVSPTGIPAASSSVTDVDSTREVSQPPADSQQQQCAPHRTRAETTPQPVQVPSAQLPAAQKPSSSRVDPTRSAPEASSGAPSEGVAQPLVAGQVQANSSSHELKESSEQRNGTRQGSELRGGFLGSALAGMSGKQAASTAPQPAEKAQAGQQTSPAASRTQHGSEAAQTEAPLQGGFLGKALSGKSRTDNTAIPGETNTHAANAQPLQATSHIPSSERIRIGAAAQASTQQTGDDDAAIGSLTTQKGEVPSMSSAADNIIAEVPPEKSTAVALQVAHRALASKPATLRPPPSGMEFEKVWKSLGADRDRQAAYLRMLQPAALPSLFKQALTGPLLASMLDALLCHVITADPGFGTEFLSALSRVPRFELTAMCVPARERQRLKGLWDDAARVMPETVASTLAGLSRTYKL